MTQFILILHCTEKLENLALEHFNIATWRWHYIWCHEKCHFRIL